MPDGDPSPRSRWRGNVARLRVGMDRALSSRGLRAGLMVLGLAALLAVPTVALMQRGGKGPGAHAVAALPRALERLERAIGYAGFIHHFKNAVLRPDEPRYHALAVASHDQAIASLREIELLAAQLDRDLVMDDLRTTLEAYRRQLDVARDAAARGLGIAQVDALVRLPDAAAALDLTTLHENVARVIDDWETREDRRRQWQGLALSALLLAVALAILALLGLAHMARKERAMRRHELDSRLASLRRLTTGVAHDVNNLLSTIFYALDLSLAEPLPERTRNLLQSARKAATRGGALTARLQAFAEPTKGRAETRPLAALLEEVDALARPQLPEGVARLAIEPVPAGLTVHCDPGQFEDAVLNLVLNARDAISGSGDGTGGRIRIAARPAPDRPAPPLQEDDAGPPPPAAGGAMVEITVTDDGPGMSEEVRRRVLEPFFSTKDASQGRSRGLGLSIVHAFARAAGGALRIESTPGQGSTMALTLPRRAPDTGAAPGGSPGPGLGARPGPTDPPGPAAGPRAGTGPDPGEDAPAMPGRHPGAPPPDNASGHAPTAGAGKEPEESGGSTPGPGAGAAKAGSTRAPGTATRPGVTAAPSPPASSSPPTFKAAREVGQDAAGMQVAGPEVAAAGAPRGGAEAVTLPEGATDAPADATGGPGGATILLAEDQAGLRALLQATLEQAGHAVLAAADGTEALDMLDAGPDRPDLLLTDIMMPELDGFGLAMRARARRPDLPVIYLTGYADLDGSRPVDAVQGPVLHKPCPPDSLLGTIEGALSAARAARKPG